MKLNDILEIIVKDLGSFGFPRAGVVVNKDDNTVTIKMATDNKEISVNATTKNPIDGVDHSFCVMNMSMLSRYMGYDPLRNANITEKSVKTMQDGITYAAAFQFTNGANSAMFGLGDPSNMPKTMRCLEPADGWDICAEPTDDDINNFASAVKVFSMVNTHARPSVKNGIMTFSFDESSSSVQGGSGTISFTAVPDVPDVKINNEFNAVNIISALRLNGCKSSIKFGSTGSCLITAESDEMIYKFVLVGRSK